MERQILVTGAKDERNESRQKRGDRVIVRSNLYSARPPQQDRVCSSLSSSSFSSSTWERTLRSFVRLRPVAGWNEAGEKSVKAGEISGAGEIEQLRSALLCVADERDYLQRQVDRMYMESVDRASGIFIVNVGKYGAAHLISNVVGHEELTTD